MNPRGTTVSSARLRRTAAAVTLAALALTACGATMPAGSASVVGADVITDRVLNDGVTELHDLLITAQSQTPWNEATATKDVLNRETRHLLLVEAAARENIVITQTQIDDTIDVAVTQQLGGDRAKLLQVLAEQQNVPPSALNEYVRDYLVQTALIVKLLPNGARQDQANALQAYLSKISTDLGVSIAPRYGTWNTGLAAIGGVPDDLSVLPSSSESATASPSPTSS
jgi:hypothetical protein